ncbi:MAG: TetR/AcrR family transcriptional regulator C-terminal ligand-binding domain-containing protein, partial [Gluconacetobacter diazotrophicus]|nr:TetR/AcrR family transcriptional regulator C-terminal ligand-binding domain-containing protein [Gluconacetobacter diazotrophicus]
SGVAKTTIYRHWPTRSALVLDACSKMGTPEPPPDTGTLEGDLLLLARRVADQLNNATWPSVLPSIIDAAERDPEVATLQASMHAGNMRPFFAAIEQARHRGDLAPDRDPDLLVAAIVGPLFYRRWFSKEPIDDAVVARVVARALA